MTGTRRKAFGAAAAAVLVGGAMLFAAVAGGPGPEPVVQTHGPVVPHPSMADDPFDGVVGHVAFVRSSGAAQCVVVVHASGADERELRCEHDLKGWPRWDAQGRVEAVRRDEAGAERLVLDPVTGDVVHRSVVAEDAVFSHGFPGRKNRNVNAAGQRAVVGSDGETAWLDVVSPDGGTRRVVETPAAGWTGFTDASWSPDGRFVMMEERRRVLVADPASGGVRELTDNGRHAVWEPARP